MGTLLPPDVDDVKGKGIISATLSVVDNELRPFEVSVVVVAVVGARNGGLGSPISTQLKRKETLV